MRAVVDTDVWIPALRNPAGGPAAIRRGLAVGPFELPVAGRWSTSCAGSRPPTSWPALPTNAAIKKQFRPGKHVRPEDAPLAVALVLACAAIVTTTMTMPSIPCST
jgi:hypothetical protein